MTTQQSGSSQPATITDPFDWRGYLFALALLSLAFTIFFAFTSFVVPAEVDRATAGILFLLFFGILAFVITTGFKPQYVPSFPIKGEQLVLMTCVAGGALFLARQTNRLPTMTAKLDMLLIALVATAFVLFIAGIAMKNKRLQKSFKKKSVTTSYVLLFIAMLAAIVGIPAVLGNDDPVMERLYAVIAIEIFGLLFGAVWVLDVMNTSPVKESTVPNGYAAVVRSDGRIARIVFEQKVAVDDAKEKMKLQDVRLKMDSFQINDCETSDHVLVDVKAFIQWQPVNTPEGLLAFHSIAQDPQKVLMELSRSATLNEISRRKSDQISGREEVIAGAVKHRVAHQSRPYGIKVEHVTITQARLRFPLPHEGISPLAEASRLDQMDPAVRRVSMKTVQHAEHLTDAQAGAANNAGGQNIK